MPRYRTQLLRVTAPASGDTALPRSAAASPLRVITLGQFEVTLPVAGPTPARSPEWTNGQSKKLLKCLLAAPNFRWTREQLIELLWPEREPQRGHEALRHALSRLRHDLEPDQQAGRRARYLGSDRQAIWLCHAPGGLDSSLWIDHMVFASIVRETLRACELARHEHTVAHISRVRGLADEAIALYGGPFLPADLYEDWTRPARESCQRLWISLLREVSDIAMQAHCFEYALSLLQQLADMAPDDEASAARLMYALAAVGRRADALRTYQQLLDNLAGELVIMPSRAVQSLAEEIRAGSSPEGLQAHISVYQEK